jgi:hypothetical protein
MSSVKFLAIAALLSAGLAVGGAAALADDASQAVNPDATTGDKAMDDLLAKEKEARKSCKIDICSILRNKKADGPDVSCHVVQTWPKKALDEMLGRAHVSWPWSHVHCQTDVKMKRATLISAATEAKYDATFDQHDLNCEIERGNGEKYTFKVSVTPKASFEAGKATKVLLNWGDVEAPLLAKGVIWPITGLDNKTGMLSGEAAKLFNSFSEKSCDEIKDQLK